MTGGTRGASRGGLLEDLRRTWTARGRAAAGCFFVEGTRLHERALRSAAGLDAVLMAEGFRDDRSPRVRSLVAEIERRVPRVEVAPDTVLAELTGGRSLGAVVGLARIPPAPSLGEICERAGPAPLLLVGLEIEDPGNVGALVRTALASGAEAYVAVGAGDPHHPRAVRTSMGSVFKLALPRFDSWAAFDAARPKPGLRLLGAATRGGVSPAEIEPGGRGIAVVMGSEAFGLPAEMTGTLDGIVSLPMAAGVDSLSVNAAAAVILYAVRARVGRRRERGVSHA